MTLFLAPVLLIAIAGPFVYYSIQVNKYASAHQPEGFKFPMIFDFWKSIAAAGVDKIARVITVKLMYPIMYKIAKVTDD